MAQLKQYAKAHDDKLNFGSPGAGTVLHFLGIQIGRGLGIAMTYIPYRGANPALTDLLGGAVQAVVLPLSDVLVLHRAGKVRVLATTGTARSKLVDGIPTMKELGVDIDVTAWAGLYGPAGLPAPLAEKLRQAVQQALRSPGLQEKLMTMGQSAASQHRRRADRPATRREQDVGPRSSGPRASPRRTEPARDQPLPPDAARSGVAIDKIVPTPREALDDVASGAKIPVGGFSTAARPDESLDALRDPGVGGPTVADGLDAR